jgi:PucR C-terminal helix-turn-helix domain
MHVHVNTVYQRLERVDRVLGGPGWREPQGSLEMQMALQLHRAAARRRGSHHRGPGDRGSVGGMSVDDGRGTADPT